MKEAIYSWIKCLAIFYILLTMLIHLVPTGKYQRYVRFFMGLLLIFMMSTPIFSILGKGQELTVSFLENFSRENKEKELQEFQNLQKIYLEKGYEMELEQKIRESLEKRGIEVYKVKVNIEGEDAQAEILLKKKISQEEKRGIADELVEEWGINENRIHIQTAKDESGKVGDSLTSWDTSGRGSDASL